MKKFFSRFYLAIILAFMYLPIVTLIIFSFNESKNMATWTGFTLDWYGELFSDPAIGDAVFVTLSIAVIAALSATLIGTLGAFGIYGLRHKRKRFKNFVLNVTYIPMINADIVTGISLLLLFIFINMQRGYWTMLIAHITFCIPYVVLSVLPKLNQMSPLTYEAALDMGAKPGYAFRKVIIPQIMPGIVAGLILSFTMSFDDFMISFFTAQGTTENLSTYIYSMARMGINPSINALSAIMFAIVLTLLIVMNVLSIRRDKKVLGAV